ncbi:hypothetical protein CHUAL_004556 [Chamberlinius hualienensis]
MGKKTKVGKQRRDKFYHLAKETGYRSRAAFKLLQLSRKHGFLRDSTVLVDLCAAPGGWLQVASKNMPVPHIIIGIDLAPIKPIPDVISLREDITTPKCRQALKRELQTRKADCFLNDGAPNVGQNWLLDAFTQARLTLSAFKLASEFLRKGGWFITKVFRSKDYNALLWVFQQFFKKVYATKPSASRLESAEIFVVCKGYLAPDKIDPKFMDPKSVFAEVELEPSATKLNIGHPEKTKAKAEGYRTGDYTLYHRVSVTQFVEGKSHIELLNDCSEITFDNEVIANHRLTTDEIKECCKDIKVLGRKELKLILTWRKNLRKELYPDKDEKGTKADESTDEEAEDEKIDREIEELKIEEAREIKLKKKKVLSERRKLRDKMNLNMILPKDEPVVSEDVSLFQLVTIKNRKQLEEEAEKDVAFLDEHLEDSDEEEEVKSKLPKYLAYERSDDLPDDYDDNSDEDMDSDADSMELINSREIRVNSNENIEEVKEDETGNPLITDLDNATEDEKNRRKVALWFGKESFAGLDDEDDAGPSTENGFAPKSFKDDDDDDSSSSDDSDFDIENDPRPVANSQKEKKRILRDAKKDGFEIVSQSTSVAQPKSKKKKSNLDCEGLALGSLLIRSKKSKRDIMDLGWNRYTNNDENLPNWFAKDEEKHYKKHLPVTKDMVSDYKEKLKEINARPIKKIAEAKARKKKRSMRKMTKVRKKAENVSESLDLSNKEKMEQIKAIYKRAGVGAKPKKEMAYVVSKKGLAGKRVSRPAGVKGRFRVVDPRMKKDERMRKQLDKQSKSKKRLPKAKLNKLKNMNKNKQRKSSKPPRK